METETHVVNIKKDQMRLKFCLSVSKLLSVHLWDESLKIFMFNDNNKLTYEAPNIYISNNDTSCNGHL